MYILNMVQHTVDGDVISPALTYETNDAWKAKYHHEFDYAIAAENINGIDILITDMNLEKVFSDSWRREGVDTKES